MKKVYAKNDQRWMIFKTWHYYNDPWKVKHFCNFVCNCEYCNVSKSKVENADTENSMSKKNMMGNWQTGWLWPIINLFQETKKCLDAGRGQSMDLLYVAPCQNIPSQVESSLSVWFNTSTRLWPPKTFACSRSGTSTTISTNTRSITCPHLPSSTMWYSQEALCTHVAR